MWFFFQLLSSRNETKKKTNFALLSAWISELRHTIDPIFVSGFVCIILVYASFFKQNRMMKTKSFTIYSRVFGRRIFIFANHIEIVFVDFVDLSTIYLFFGCFTENRKFDFIFWLLHESIEKPLKLGNKKHRRKIPGNA